MELDPDITRRVLLNPYFLNFTYLTAEICNLFFNIYKKGRVSLKIDQVWIKHVIQQNTVCWLSQVVLELLHQCWLVIKVLTHNSLTLV
jgi:hypothetical protein